MPDPDAPNPREQDIMAGDRRISRPDASLPDWHSPDVHYRPVPIVWFTGAVMVQAVVLTAAFVLLGGAHGGWTVGVGALTSAMIGRWAWERGIERAGFGWRGALVAILTAQFLLVCIGASDRF